MTTTKRRLNITLSREAGELLTQIAKRDNVPEATKVSELVNISLALEEDRFFSMLGDKRMSEKGKALSHAEVWGK